jgi:hypothetical protein
VEQMLVDGGYPCPSVWLDFHERYAGYIEKFGKDAALWGLAHPRAIWVDTNSVEAEFDDSDESWTITCADVHPSYTLHRELSDIDYAARLLEDVQPHLVDEVSGSCFRCYMDGTHLLIQRVHTGELRGWRRTQ